MKIVNYQSFVKIEKSLKIHDLGTKAYLSLSHSLPYIKDFKEPVYPNFLENYQRYNHFSYYQSISHVKINKNMVMKLFFLLRFLITSVLQKLRERVLANKS